MAIDEPSASAADAGAQRMLAVALKYSPGEAAPTVVAKGRGLLAEEIIARAREHGIYVHESPALVALLAQVDMDQHIPPALYVAVAELLAWLYRIEQGDADAADTPAPTFRAVGTGGDSG